MQKNIITTGASIILAVIFTSLFWRSPYLLILLLSATTYLKHVAAPIKNELVTFIIFAILGSSMESVIMLSGPWSYASPDILNIPIWLPFLWGLAGTVSGSIYELLNQKNS